MRSIAKTLLLISVVGLSACASVSVSDMYRPNFGVRVFPHFDASADPDPAAISNGLYVPRGLRPPPSQSSWSP